jgi:hypothetical protein
MVELSPGVTMNKLVLFGLCLTLASCSISNDYYNGKCAGYDFARASYLIKKVSKLDHFLVKIDNKIYGFHVDTNGEIYDSIGNVYEFNTETSIVEKCPVKVFIPKDRQERWRVEYPGVVDAILKSIEIANR